MPRSAPSSGLPSGIAGHRSRRGGSCAGGSCSPPYRGIHAAGYAHQAAPRNRAGLVFVVEVVVSLRIGPSGSSLSARDERRAAAPSAHQLRGDEFLFLRVSPCSRRNSRNLATCSAAGDRLVAAVARKNLGLRDIGHTPCSSGWPRIDSPAFSGSRGPGVSSSPRPRSPAATPVTVAKVIVRMVDGGDRLQSSTG